MQTSPYCQKADQWLPEDRQGLERDGSQRDTRTFLR